MGSSLKHVSGCTGSFVWMKHTWDLVVVDTNSMVLGITVEEHAELQEHVRAVLDTWNHGTG